MAEIPSNILLAEEFSALFDGFSIGSNDLTQLTLGIDRDSAVISGLFDEQDKAPKILIGMLLQKAANGKQGQALRPGTRRLSRIHEIPWWKRALTVFLSTPMR